MLIVSLDEKQVEITPIEYDADCPFKYNNFVYRAALTSPTIANSGASNETKQQPGCAMIPEGVTQFIVRLPNPDAEGMNTSNRVENEVAIISLASAALAHLEQKVVPSVYGWGSAAGASPQGWILQELMPGTPVDAGFRTMDLQQKKAIFAQMAEILDALQKYQLPQTITGFGGLTFDQSGNTVSATMTSVDAGPWPSYEASFQGRLKVAIAEADKSPIIRGWRNNGVRERIDAFVESGLPAQFLSLASKQDKCVVHADFTTNNMLYDPKSQRITALLDYDFACISHPSYEFFRSFNGCGGQFGGWPGDEDNDLLALQDYKLHGFPSPLPLSSNTDGVKWEDMKAWEDELERVQVQRPRTTQGIEKAADVDAVLQMIIPWRITNPDILRLQPEESTMKCRDENEEQLVKMLDHLGF
ncbi:Uncharacterized protein BP5553_04582 [Venustampulla echinocandica]|uniref:Aminoglycoside phosphotransferase domain-containing protein n=1 Tax=Venustampulla echinocandica TaxID=2656787 RepID=A0A370TNP5_9HELO|nr:Uncharacterized protein BP5553_04582 [Venustampulla echinocandica]RDL37149.1 Uncharacterized protein BP5553_04582 [Venustampulla echinocandica]